MLAPSSHEDPCFKKGRKTHKLFLRCHQGGEGSKNERTFKTGGENEDTARTDECLADSPGEGEKEKKSTNRAWEGRLRVYTAL